MGFFSSLLKGIGTVAGAVLNPAGAIAGLFGASKSTQAALAPAAPGLTALSSVGVATKALIDAPSLSAIGANRAQALALAARSIGPGVPKAVVSAGTTLKITGGNGKVAKRTIVQTINLDTGQVVLETVLEGAPFLMNKAVRELARTTKKLRKANRKIPTRTVKQSLSAQLTERVLDQTIQDVGHPHHGHHNGT